MANMTLKMMFVALLSDAGPYFFPPRRLLLRPQRILTTVGGESKSHSYPATCVLSFRVECCCLLALQEKKYCGGVYPSYVHYFPATYVLLRKSRKKVFKKMRENCGGNGNPPPVNKEDSSCRFFSC